MSWMCKDDRDWSSPISIKGKSSWEDNILAESEAACSPQEIAEADCDGDTTECGNICHKEAE